MVKEYYPFYKTIGCFARITDIMPKSLEELKELRVLGYDGITIGVETGDDESLTFMNKGFFMIGINRKAEENLNDVYS